MQPEMEKPVPERDDHEQVWRKFHDAVNMAPAEIEEWLETEESHKVGFKRDGGESVGHASGRRIVQILRTKKADLDGADYAHMRKVVGFVARHRGQGPHDEYRIPTSRWRYSLMNWGHDPLKD
jgi:hypothetical protein